MEALILHLLVLVPAVIVFLVGAGFGIWIAIKRRQWRR